MLKALSEEQILKDEYLPSSFRDNFFTTESWRVKNSELWLEVESKSSVKALKSFSLQQSFKSLLEKSSLFLICGIKDV